MGGGADQAPSLPPLPGFCPSSAVSWPLPLGAVDPSLGLLPPTPDESPSVRLPGSGVSGTSWSLSLLVTLLGTPPPRPSCLWGPISPSIHCPPGPLSLQMKVVSGSYTVTPPTHTHTCPSKLSLLPVSQVVPGFGGEHPHSRHCPHPP